MKYENPILEVIEFEVENIVRTSTVTGESSGGGQDVEGPWGN